jgi:dihydroorotase
MNGAMIDMPTTMSKMLACGMPLVEVVRASTWTPAQLIKRTELGHLSEGAVADIAVWTLQEGDFGFGDASNGRHTGKQRLFCELTLAGGRVSWDWNARAGTDYRKLPPTYGVRPKIDHIVRPN